MTFFVPVTFLLLNYLLSCFAAHASISDDQGIHNILIHLKNYSNAYFEVRSKQFEVHIKSAHYKEVKQVLSESYRLDRLYGLKWINELIASRVFQANEVIDKDTKRRYANEYKVEKLLNKSTFLDIGSVVLLKKIKEKWEARARLYAAEDAYLSRSSTKCLKKDDNTTQKVNLISATKRIRDLEEFVNVKLFETGEAYMNEEKSDLNYKMNADNLMTYITYLSEKVVEVELERLNYLQILGPRERAKVLIDTVNAEFHTPAK
ncbi:unnamed protein product [Trichobilharzia szidati]|nr:unnamed protein product [Trichobilharzia szidati]